MSDIEKILQNKAQIVQKLYEWALVFVIDLDEYGNKTTEGLDYVWGLAEKLENNQCTQDDYENILFHIWQINYNGEYDDENEATFIKGFTHIGF